MKRVKIKTDKLVVLFNYYMLRSITNGWSILTYTFYIFYNLKYIYIYKKTNVNVIIYLIT